MPRLPRPPRKSGSAAPCWYSRLLYSNLLASSIFIESPSKGGAYCKRYVGGFVGTFSAFVYEKSLYFFFHYTDHCYFPWKVENEVQHLIGNFAIKFPCLIRINFGNWVIFGNSFATSHHAITGLFYGVEKVLYEAFCNSNTVEAYSNTDVRSRDADSQGGNEGMLSRVKPSSPLYSLYIEHTYEEKN